MDDRTRDLYALIRSFPSLDRPDLPEPDPFDPVWFDTWAYKRWTTPSWTHSARFVLNVWSGSTCGFAHPDDRVELGTPAAYGSTSGALARLLIPRWQVGAFDVVEAFQVWDRPHRQAFLRWAETPWFP